MIYAYIDEQRVNVSVVRLCHALGVSTSGYYAGRQRGPSRRALANEALLVHLRAIRVETRETYGSPRMHAELVARGQPCSVNRVARLMRLNHLPARHKRPYHPKTTCPDPTRPVVPNRLAQDFTADAPNQKWVGDITYIPTGQGWLYLAAVLDLHSRRIVGWALDQTMTTDLVRAALEMALGRRQPAAGPGASYRSRQSIHQRGLSRPAQGARPGGQPERHRPLLRQCADGKFLWHAQSRIDLSHHLRHAGRGPAGHRFVHRRVL